MRRKIFLVDVWLERGEGKNWWGPGVFFLSSPRCFLSKIRRKLSGRNLIGKWRQWPCPLAHGLVQFFVVYFYFFWVWFVDSIRAYFFFFFFWFPRQGSSSCSSVSYLFIFIFCFLLWFFGIDVFFFSRYYF